MDDVIPEIDMRPLAFMNQKVYANLLGVGEEGDDFINAGYFYDPIEYGIEDGEDFDVDDIEELNKEIEDEKDSEEEVYQKERILARPWG